MKTILAAAAMALSLVAGTASASSLNYVVNGSFEDLGGQSFNRSSNWGNFATLPGWTDTSGKGIEIQSRNTLGTIDAQDGNNYLEVDSDGNSVVTQNIFLDVGHYMLSFYYSPRTLSRAADTSDMDYRFGSFVGGTILGNDAARFSIGGWTQITASFFVSSAGTFTLAFGGLGTSDTFGALVDNVSLTSVAAVPVPAAGLLLVGGLGALTLARRRKSA